MKRLLGFLLCTLALAPLSMAKAQVIYIQYSTNFGSTNTFGLLDLTPGATFGQFTKIGNGLTKNYYGLGFASDGNLYGYAPTGTIYRINTTNGTDTKVGMAGYGVYGVAGDGTSSSINLISDDNDYFTNNPTALSSTHERDVGIPLPDGMLAYDSSTGYLYAASVTNNNGIADDHIYKFSSSGTAIDLNAASGTDSGTANLFAGVFANKTLYGFSAGTVNGPEVYSFDTNTGASTFLGTTQLPTNAIIFGSAYNVGSAASLPEPTSACLLLPGLACVAHAILWRRKRRLENPS